MVRESKAVCVLIKYEIDNHQKVVKKLMQVAHSKRDISLK
ncbi:hypothetical protein AAA799D11_00127 [Marine Group I thaumarchaeote SCGC AAA799-D11]|uniref:Uncharacterized protein n=1 Tax=Marine Group I thaumarchaeote SCGC AAA799-D11 TaxID=1502291 RepID=A0A087RV26_9ARCH|nr:hypothetical protein AAA799D11_00127 [Marine Group I thaumarchaeote SCGC AAA799-D11]